MQADTFPKGTYYTIICKQGQQALKITESDPKKYNKSRIHHVPHNQNDDGQIFLIDEVKPGKFEIVNCISSLVFDEESNEIRLKQGKQSGDQLFCIEEVQGLQAFHKYYYIKTSQKGDRALFLEGILRYGDFEANNQAFMFRFQKVTNNNSINNSSLIINNFTGKAIDVPGNSWDAGDKISQWEVNYRWNQRWQFQKSGKGHVIKNLSNGQNLDISGQSKKDHAEIIQWTHTGNVNQQWAIERCANKIYKFVCLFGPKRHLAIKKEDVNNGGHLEVCESHNPTCEWRLEGHQI